MDTTAPLVGNAAAGLGDLLAGLGITAGTKRATVESIVAHELEQRGLAATMTSLRYGRLVLTADQTNAALLRYDETHILTALNEQLDEPVRSIRVSVAR